MIVKKWEIYRANLDPVIGSEQGKTRPVLIISEDSVNQVLNTVNVLPITSKKQGRIIYPNEGLLTSFDSGLPNESIVLCHQIRTLDKVRLSKIYGKVEDPIKQFEIEDALTFQLDLG
jgi:mRNA interferase MazF